jgi:hypothetical protein
MDRHRPSKIGSWQDKFVRKVDVRCTIQVSPTGIPLFAMGTKDKVHPTFHVMPLFHIYGCFGCVYIHFFILYML